MPVEALKNATGWPEGSGARRATSRAMLAIRALFSRRTSPRRIRWVRNSCNMVYADSPVPVAPPRAHSPVVVALIAQTHDQVSSHLPE